MDALQILKQALIADGWLDGDGKTRLPDLHDLGEPMWVTNAFCLIKADKCVFYKKYDKYEDVSVNQWTWAYKSLHTKEMFFPTKELAVKALFSILKKRNQ